MRENAKIFALVVVFSMLLVPFTGLAGVENSVIPEIKPQPEVNALFDEPVLFDVDFYETGVPAISLVNTEVDVENTYTFYAEVNYTIGGVDQLFDGINNTAVDFTVWYDEAGTNEMILQPEDTTHRTRAFNVTWFEGDGGLNPEGAIIRYPVASMGTDEFQLIGFDSGPAGGDHWWITINVSFGPQMRVADGGGFVNGNSIDEKNPALSFNDANSWNFMIEVYDIAFPTAFDKGFEEFGVNPFVNITASGNPAGSAPPGSVGILLAPNSNITYAANGQYYVNVSVGDLVSGPNTITADNVQVQLSSLIAAAPDSEIFASTYFVAANTSLSVWGNGAVPITTPDNGTTSHGSWGSDFNYMGRYYSTEVIWRVNIPAATPNGMYEAPITFTIEAMDGTSSIDITTTISVVAAYPRIFDVDMWKKDDVGRTSTLNTEVPRNNTYTFYTEFNYTIGGIDQLFDGVNSTAIDLVAWYDEGGPNEIIIPPEDATHRTKMFNVTWFEGDGGAMPENVIIKYPLGVPNEFVLDSFYSTYFFMDHWRLYLNITFSDLIQLADGTGFANGASGDINDPVQSYNDPNSWNFMFEVYDTMFTPALDNGYEEFGIGTSGLTPHLPIRINSNADFDEAHGVVNWATGVGSAGNPWIIEGWDINGTGYGYALYIGNTTDYFMIKNNNLHNSSNPTFTGYGWPYFGDQGLTLYNVTNGKIENNIVRDNYRGIYLYNNSNQNVVSNNTVSNNGHTGIHVSSSSHKNTVNSNTITYSGSWGLVVYSSDDNQIIDNKVENNTYIGIYDAGGDLTGSINNSYIDNKIINNNDYGFYSYNSMLPKIEGGVIENQEVGIFFSNTSFAEIVNVSLIANDTGISIDNSFSNNFRNLDIDGGKTGIFLNSADENVIANSTFTNINLGIYFAHSNNNTITNSTLSDSEFGIYMKFSQDNIIDHNNLNNITGFDGDETSNQSYETNLEVYQNDVNWSNYNSFQEQLAIGDGGNPLFTRAVDVIGASLFMVEIEGNMTDVEDLDLGIFLDGKDGNPVDGQTQTGEFVVMDADSDANESINMFLPQNGTYLIRVFGFNVTGNPGHFNMTITILRQKSTGILLIESSNNNITKNTFKNNTYAVNLTIDSNQNRLWHNEFLFNINQAYDDGINFWDNGYPSGGNYWSDYTGVDLNSTPTQDVPPADGIGDTPYTNIAGGSGALDNYPLMVPWGTFAPNAVMDKWAPATAIPGEAITYWLNYTNTGNDWAYNIVITETYPPWVTFVSSIPFPDVGNNIWIIPALAPGASGSIQITVQVDLAVPLGTWLVNNVTLYYEDGIGTPYQDWDTASTLIVGPVMTINKTAPATATLGVVMTYEIWIYNAGPGWAYNVVITETYPDPWGFWGAIPSPDVGNNVWLIASIGPGLWNYIEITYEVDDNADVMMNTVSLDYEDTVGTPQPTEYAWANTTILQPIIELTKEAQAIATSGEIITYYVNFTDLEPLSMGIIEVQLSELYPPGVTFISANPPPTIGNNFWYFPGGLALPASFEITVRIDNDTTGIISNKVSLYYWNFGGYGRPPEYAWANTSIINPQMVISKTAPFTANPGETIMYTITYQNVGTDTAYNVWINDTYPINVTFLNASLIPTVGDNSWYIGSVPPGGGGVIFVNVSINLAATGTLNNSVSLDYDNSIIPMPTEWAFAETQVLSASLNMSFTKSGPATANPGETIMYILSYQNTGAQTAYDVWITETYPVNVTFVDSNPVPSYGNNEWDIGDLAPGESGIIFINVTIDGGASGTLVNQAQLEYDDDLGNAQPPELDTFITTIVNPAMTIFKSAPATANTGDFMVYTINYSNIGDDWAYNVTITETYPVNVTFISAIPAPTVGNNVWIIPAVAPGGSGSIQVTVQINPNAPESLMNFVQLEYENSIGTPQNTVNDTANTLVLDESTPPQHSNESPPIDGYSAVLDPIISVHVTDLSGLNTSTIRLYVNGFSIFYSLTPIPNGYNVSYWHAAGFIPDEVVTIRIVAEDTLGNLLDFTWQFTNPSVFQIDLKAGWNLVSFPLVQFNNSILNVLSSIAGQWESVQYYDATDNLDRWKTYSTLAPVSVNDLLELNNKMGFWLFTTQNCTLSVMGITPTSTQIQLYAGWNLVSYPSMTQDTVANALWGTGADMVAIGNASNPYNLENVGPTYMMKPGEGYWVHVPADTVWVVDW